MRRRSESISPEGCPPPPPQDDTSETAGLGFVCDTWGSELSGRPTSEGVWGPRATPQFQARPAPWAIGVNMGSSPHPLTLPNPPLPLSLRAFGALREHSVDLQFAFQPAVATRWRPGSATLLVRRQHRVCTQRPECATMGAQARAERRHGGHTTPSSSGAPRTERALMAHIPSALNRSRPGA